MSDAPVFFDSAAALQRWFARHADTQPELIVGFMKVGSGQPSVTWPQAVDEALCVGWIDGVRRRIDEQRYQIRFTPRRALSHWSAVNIKRVAVLLAESRMTPAGLAAFDKRTEAKSMKASYEQPTMPELAAPERKQLRANAQAWAYFKTLPPGYLKRVIWWVVSAKQAATRVKRLGVLIQACAEGRRL
jgi:uncharacterized protein YdeI (YjbR/CyaY-like superfamily)